MGKLTDAVRKNDIEEIKKLLTGEYKNSPLINEEKDKDGWTPLCLAALRGYVEAIQALGQLGAKVDSIDKDGKTPLYGAALHGQVEAIQALVQLGAKVDSLDKDGKTPLYVAAQNGQLEAIQALVQLGANNYLKTK